MLLCFVCLDIKCDSCLVQSLASTTFLQKKPHNWRKFVYPWFVTSPPLLTPRDGCCDHHHRRIESQISAEWKRAPFLRGEKSDPAALMPRSFSWEEEEEKCILWKADKIPCHKLPSRRGSVLQRSTTQLYYSRDRACGRGSSKSFQLAIRKNAKEGNGVSWHQRGHDDDDDDGALVS